MSSKDRRKSLISLSERSLAKTAIRNYQAKLELENQAKKEKNAVAIHPTYIVKNIATKLENHEEIEEPTDEIQQPKHPEHIHDRASHPGNHRNGNGEMCTESKIGIENSDNKMTTAHTKICDDRTHFAKKFNPFVRKPRLKKREMLLKQEAIPEEEVVIPKICERLDRADISDEGKLNFAAISSNGRSEQSSTGDQMNDNSNRQHTESLKLKVDDTSENYRESAGELINSKHSSLEDESRRLLGDDGRNSPKLEDTDNIRVDFIKAEGNNVRVNLNIPSSMKSNEIYISEPVTHSIQASKKKVCLDFNVNDYVKGEVSGNWNGFWTTQSSNQCANDSSHKVIVVPIILKMTPPVPPRTSSAEEFDPHLLEVLDNRLEHLRQSQSDLKLGSNIYISQKSLENDDPAYELPCDDELNDDIDVICGIGVDEDRNGVEETLESSDFQPLIPMNNQEPPRELATKRERDSGKWDIENIYENIDACRNDRYSASTTISADDFEDGATSPDSGRFELLDKLFLSTEIISESKKSTLALPQSSLLTLGLIPGQHEMPEDFDFKRGSLKSLWQERPDVISSNILTELSEKQIKLQEAIFELLTTESSYVYDLKLLVDHFMAKIRLRVGYIIDIKDFNGIFPNNAFETILKAGIPFLSEILAMLKKDMMLTEVCSAFEEHYRTQTKAYLSYSLCSTIISNNFKDLLVRNRDFKSLTENLTSEVGKLHLDSYLTVPMRRITRLPLLMKAVIQYAADVKSENMLQYAKTYKTFLALARQCDTQQENVLRWEKMKALQQELVFSADGPKFDFTAKKRYLMFRATAFEVGQPGAYTKKEKLKLEIFLFNDLIIAARKDKKRDKVYTITDYCPREVLSYKTQEIFDSSGLVFTVFHFKLKMNIGVSKRVDLSVIFDSLSDQKKIKDLLSSKGAQREAIEQIKEIMVVSSFEKERSDQLTANVADIISVSDISGDWYYGYRRSDKARGWIPASCCVELLKDI